jgi:hypothetical protein
VTRTKIVKPAIPPTTEQDTEQPEEVILTHTKIVKPAIPLTAEQISKHIEEAAYYKWLNRGYLAQVSDEMNDWVEAEKEIRQNPTLMLASS